MRYLIPFIILNLLFTLSACSESEAVEVVDIEELLPQSEREYEYTEEIEEEEIAEELSTLQKQLSAKRSDIHFDTNQPFYTEKTTLFPNRLSFEEKNEVFFTIDSISYQYITWTYPDSAKTINAFYNWIDCFGNRCKSIRLHEEKNLSLHAFIIWVKDSSLSYLASDYSLPYNEWKESLFEEDEEFLFILQQNPRQRVNWKHSILAPTE